MQGGPASLVVEVQPRETARTPGGEPADPSGRRRAMRRERPRIRGLDPRILRPKTGHAFRNQPARFSGTHKSVTLVLVFASPALACYEAGHPTSEFDVQDAQVANCEVTAGRCNETVLCVRTIRTGYVVAFAV